MSGSGNCSRRKSPYPSLAQKVPHASTRVGTMHAADHGHFLDDGQHFEFADLHRDRIGIAIGHQAARRAVARHAKAARIVDDDQVGPALFDELRP